MPTITRSVPVNQKNLWNEKWHECWKIYPDDNVWKVKIVKAKTLIDQAILPESMESFVLVLWRIVLQEMLLQWDKFCEYFDITQTQTNKLISLCRHYFVLNLYCLLVIQKLNLNESYNWITIIY